MATTVTNIRLLKDYLPIFLWVSAGMMIMMIMMNNLAMKIGAVVAFLAPVGRATRTAEILISFYERMLTALSLVSAILEILQTKEVENQNPRHTDSVLDGSVHMEM